MSFSAEWLDLRDPADRAARDPGLAAVAAAWLGDGLAVDLGSGTGATVRAMPEGPRWRLVDLDAGLLAEARARFPGVATVEADLADVAALPLADARMATCSALLDLGSAAWLEALAARAAGLGLGLYAALSYDGRMAWDPGLPEDAAVTAAFNADQRRDKGLGPALGPDAALVAARLFAGHGYEVRLAQSPWRLGPEQAALQAELAAGIAAATGAEAWGQARRAACLSTACEVGHWDLLALPARGASAQSKTTSVSRL
jgi:hypothetical protein